MEKVTDCKSSEGSSPDRENDIEATLRTVEYLELGMSPNLVCKLPIEGIVGSSSWSYLKSHFVGMGFSAAMVDKAIEENGEEDANLLLETLLTYSVLEKFNSKFPDGGFSPIKEEFLSTGATSNNDWEIEGPDTSANDHIGTKTSLLMMKFSEEEVDLAINTLGTEVPIRELADLIIANQIGAQTSKEVALESSQDRLLANKEHPTLKCHSHGSILGKWIVEHPGLLQRRSDSGLVTLFSSTYSFYNKVIVLIMVEM